MKTIICMKWGTLYDALYVNKLYGMVSRNITPPYRFYCFTDDSNGIRDEVSCLPLPDLGCEVPNKVPGKWRKTALWGATLHDLSGPALFIDLDTVIVSNIDCFFDYKNAGDVILARNWLKPFHRLGQTTLFRYQIGEQPYMLEDFQKNPQTIAEHYRYEQHYVTKHLKASVSYWPKAWVRHYRVHCLGNYFLRYIRPAKIPRGAKIIAFPGQPNPTDALLGQWTNSHPVSPLKHLLNTFRAGKRVKDNPIKHLRSFQLPCPWVAEHWRE